MKAPLLLLICIPILTFSQSQESINAFMNSRPAGLGRPVLLPDGPRLGGLFDLYDTIEHRQRQWVFVINSDSAYHAIFPQYHYTPGNLKSISVKEDSFYYKLISRYLVDSLPVIDFTRQELVVYTACGQCLAFCSHNGKPYEPCHRNACNFMVAWYLRDKEFF